MRRSVLQTVLVLATCFLPQFVQAQSPRTPAMQVSRPNPPAVSPYLNLLRAGSDPAINYFNLVRPQIDYGNAINGLQQQVATVGAAVANGTQLGGPNAVVTGHPVQFLNYSTFYPGLSTRNPR